MVTVYMLVRGILLSMTALVSVEINVQLWTGLSLNSRLYSLDVGNIDQLRLLLLTFGEYNFIVSDNQVHQCFITLILVTKWNSKCWEINIYVCAVQQEV